VKDYGQGDISLHLLVDRMLDGFWLVNEHGVILDVNEQYLALSGYTKEEVVGHLIEDFELFESNQDTKERLAKITELGSVRFETKHVSKNGKVVDVEVMASAVPNKQGLFFGLIRDIRVRKEYETKLQLTNNIINQASDGILVTDSSGIIEYVNQSFTNITGYKSHEVIGKTPAVLSSGMQSTSFYDQMWDSLEKKGIWAGEVWNKKKTGEIYPEWLTINSLKSGKKTSHYIAHFNDLSESKKLTNQQEFLEFHDQLTGIANLKLFNQRLSIAQMLYEKQNVPYVIIMLDVSRFKTVNDALGHAAGDQILKEIAKRLTKSIRLSDTLARFSGNQFVILMSEQNVPQNTDKICQNIADYFNEPFYFGNQNIKLSVNVGAAIFPNHSKNHNDILAYAEMAMYHAKKQQFDYIQLFDNQIKQALSTRNKLEEGLKTAITHDELTVYVQPQVNSATNEVFAIECLLRWHHPELGHISPDTFIPIAEESGLICEIGDWVMEQALTHVRKWQLDTVFDGTVAVNVSIAQFLNPNYLSGLRNLLSKTLVAANKIEIEVTESLFSEQDADHLAILKELNLMGFPIAIDDFGTGYSSLHRIKMMPINTIKIDKCFIDNIETDISDQTIVQAVVNIAKSIGLNVLAEGVETQGQVNKLAEFGCYYCQGYFYAKPQPIDTFPNWLSEFKNQCV